MGCRSNMQKKLRTKRMMLRAKYAGSGKSFIGKHLQKMGYTTLFVVPQNMLKQDILVGGLNPSEKI